MKHARDAWSCFEERECSRSIMGHTPTVSLPLSLSHRILRNETHRYLSRNPSDPFPSISSFERVKEKDTRTKKGRFWYRVGHPVSIYIVGGDPWMKRKGILLVIGIHRSGSIEENVSGWFPFGSKRDFRSRRVRERKTGRSEHGIDVSGRKDAMVERYLKTSSRSIVSVPVGLCAFHRERQKRNRSEARRTCFFSREMSRFA